MTAARPERKYHARPAPPRIVVGIDTSVASTAALRWAAAQAAALHAQIIAVHAWQPATCQLAPYAHVPAHPTPGEERRYAEQLLDHVVRGALGERPPVPVRTVVAEGPAVAVLLEHARTALLLALGHRPHAGTAAPAVGAVARGCLSAATVPVVSIPADPGPHRRTAHAAHAALRAG
ncbi:universal stress protein [Streptomyces sp. NBC_01465]|uniref:universal stress protein n=1 Tax=Streptomyces sp. NBC_01465 TaxID=2903878 RepID=UPI002E30E7D2|nr:universal stress protein [Streptomyces sp. NBC_01465]